MKGERRFSPFRVYVLSLLIIVTLLWLPVYLFLPHRQFYRDVNYLRLVFFVLALIMVLTVRFLTFFVDKGLPSRGLKNFLAYIFMLPVILIPLLGVYLAAITGSPWEYTLFYIIGLYHALRFWRWKEQKKRVSTP